MTHPLPKARSWRLVALVLARGACVGACVGAPLLALAQSANSRLDPTRPAVGAPSSHAINNNPGPANLPQARAYLSPNLPALGGAGPTVASAKLAPVAQGSPRLSSVVVGSASVASAVIDGQVVRLGERIKGATLVSVDRVGVLLKGLEGSTRLQLMSRTEMPVSITPVAPQAVAASASPAAAAAPEMAQAAKKEMP